MGVQGVKKYSNDMLLENEEKVAFILKNITYILNAILLTLTIFQNFINSMILLELLNLALHLVNNLQNSDLVDKNVFRHPEVFSPGSKLVCCVSSCSLISILYQLIVPLSLEAVGRADRACSNINMANINYRPRNFKTGKKNLIAEKYQIYKISAFRWFVGPHSLIATYNLL